MTSGPYNRPTGTPMFNTMQMPWNTTAYNSIKTTRLKDVIVRLSAQSMLNMKN